MVYAVCRIKLKSGAVGYRSLSLLFITLLLVLATGCSGASNPTSTSLDGGTQENTVRHSTSGYAGHQNWGFWEVSIDRVNKTVEFTPLRDSAVHLNVLGFLEPVPFASLDIDWNTLIFDPANNYVEVVVKLTHPFVGLDEFTGFDVKGILFTHGTQPLEDNSEVFAKSGEPRLANPDGLTRWWNPSEFLGGGMYGYTPGKLGSPGGAGVFTVTVNGYKYFCFGLTSYGPMGSFNLAGRGHFPAGTTLARKYKIDFGDNPADFMKFNYAVDASWEAPIAIPPSVPDDFTLSANMPEPFWVEVNVVENQLYYYAAEDAGGGRIELDITVHDWQGVGTIGDIYLDNQAVFPVPVLCTAQPITNPNARSYHVDTYATGNISDGGPKDIIVKAYSNEGSYKQGGLVPFFGPVNTPVAAYQIITLNVADHPTVDMVKEVDTLLPSPTPFTLTKDFSVIGNPERPGVYYFGPDYKMYRYPLNYSSGGVLCDKLDGFLSYSADNLWGYPIVLGRFDMAQQGAYCMMAESTQISFLPPYLIHDFCYQFDAQNDPFGRFATQGITPGLETGIMKTVDMSATQNLDDTDAIFWIYVDDDAEPSVPAPGVSIALVYYKYPFGPDLFNGDIGAVSGSPVPIGPGPGAVLAERLKAFAVCGVPFTATPGNWDIICGFLESLSNEIELFGINTLDPSDVSNEYLRTLTDFQGSPVDIEMVPAKLLGYDTGSDWIAVLEQGLSNQSILEIFSIAGTKLFTSDVLPGQPVAVDVDPYNGKVHVWYKDLNAPGVPVHAAVFRFQVY